MEFVKEGVGIICIYYVVEVFKGELGDCFLEWIGGYFEVNWLVNLYWMVEFMEMLEYEIICGVKLFLINDEWYYYMRFCDGMEGIMLILMVILFVLML